MSAAQSSLDVLNKVAAQGAPPVPAAAPQSSLDVLNQISGNASATPPGVPKPPVPRALSAPADDNRLTWSGDAPKNPPQLDQLNDMGKSMAKNLYEISAPGVMASVLQKTSPAAASYIPKALHGAPLESLPEKAVMNFLLSAAGGLEAEAPTPEGVAANRAEAATKAAADAAPKEAVQPSPQATALVKFLLNRIPGMKTLGDLQELHSAFRDFTAEHAEPDAESPAPARTTPAAQPATASATPTTTAAPSAAPAALSPEELFAQQNARSVATPNADGKTLTPDAANSDDAQGSLAQRQAAVDQYYKEHPEKKPQPEIWKRGPKTGQPKTYKVFQNGEWIERPKYK